MWELITKAKPKSEKRYAITLYVLINDEHLYVIDDLSHQQAIRNRWNGVEIKRPEVTEFNYELTNVENYSKSSKKILLFDQACLSTIASNVITKTEHNIGNMLVRDSRLDVFLHPVTEQWFISAEDFHKRKEVCQIFKDKTGFLEFEFKNQSWTELINLYLTARIGFIEESKYGPSLMEIITKQPLLPYIDTVHGVDLNLADHDDTMSIDYYRCYASILVNSEYDLPVFTQFDSIKPFDIAHFQKFKESGLYMINRSFEMGKTQYMQNGSMYFEAGWYPASVIDRCLQMNYITANDIEFQLLSSKKLNAGFFREFVHDVYNTVGKDTAKVLINNMIGYFGKMYKKSTTAAITNSEPTAYAYQLWYGNKISVSRMNNYFLLSKTDREHLLSGNLPIARQIIGSSYVELDKLVHRVCGPESIPLAFNTDSLKVFRPLEIEFKSQPTFGDIRKEAKINIRQRQHQFKNIDPYPKFELDISRGEMDYESPDTFPRLITGPAGSGKTELLKKISSLAFL